MYLYSMSSMAGHKLLKRANLVEEVEATEWTSGGSSDQKVGHRKRWWESRIGYGGQESGGGCDRSYGSGGDGYGGGKVTDGAKLLSSGLDLDITRELLLVC
ncbi:unnamed protein product [Cuscuta europaea]|uniref:Uncharacterized protein n=1 Tax=Cuscuta europaea TaxID=41803 RepID=A0A9P0YZ85_CUSEU|nr:unnamed protein product [Cuscuta europaea]